jgi:hypothetical protein
VCLGAPRTVRFGCCHLAACADCAQILLARGDPCPLCRRVLDAPGFVDVVPGSNEETNMLVDAPPTPPTPPPPPNAQVPIPAAHVAGAAPGAMTSGANDNDADVLRVWREACPELRALWRTGTDVRTWEGVTFGEGEDGAAGRVVKIVLQRKGLTGAVPAALGRLAALEWLFLHNNQLTGSVPAALGQLAALQGLWLDNNRLTGAVPAALGRLAALEVLSLGNNQLTSVPAALMRQLRGHGVTVFE